MTAFINSSVQSLRVAAAMALIALGGVASAHATSVGAYVQAAGTAPVVQKLAAASLVVTPTVVELGDWMAPKSGASARDDLIQIGAKRVVGAAATAVATRDLLRWTATEDGGQLAAISLVSNEAFGMRAGLVVDALPANAILRVYTEDFRDQAYETTAAQVLQLLQTNTKAGDTSKAARTWWTPAVDGDALTLEIELPAGVATSGVQVAVPSVLHIYENIFNLIDDGSQMQAKINNAAGCTLDSTCYDGYAQQRDAVARMHFVTDAGGFLCTGTLLNDRNSTGTPYFLTANHCISNQASASSLQTFWFYRTPSCNSRLLSSSSKSLKGGAKLLHTQASPDMTLLQLNDQPPAGAVFAAWDAAALTSGQAVVGIHHPRGDLQKISFGKVVGTSACTPGQGFFRCFANTAMTESYYRVQWAEGMTEGGSSGSGLFVNGALTGVLSNGTASCTATGGVNNYARLDQVFPAIKQWLYADVAPVAEQAPAQGLSAVFRFYNNDTGAHFYTSSVAQRDAVIAFFPGFRFEGIAFYANAGQAEGLSPVYRFYNTQNAAHVYTADVLERAAMQAQPGIFNDEGVAWWARNDASAETVEVFRFVNQQTGRYFYTANAGERDYVIATYADLHYQGVAYNVWVGQ